MNEAKREAVIYAVSSLRNYAGGEEYYGTDGVFLSEDDAASCIFEEMKLAIEGNGYESEDVKIDRENFTIDALGDHFEWKIERFSIDLDALIKGAG